jgi:hypothetical protein
MVDDAKARVHEFLLNGARCPVPAWAVFRPESDNERTDLL